MRETIAFDAGWRFHAGDIQRDYPAKKGPVYTQSKTETAIWGPAAVHYNDRSEAFSQPVESCTERWDMVDLPHDYIIAQIPERENNEALGFFQYHNAWYRKHFPLPESDAGKRLTLYFEGVAGYATVYVNGCLAARHFSGYASFEVDITDFARCGQENVVAVYVDTAKQEGWWYGGGGIYRHVWLVKTASVSVDRYGVYVHPEERGERSWAVPVETTVRNDGDVDAAVTVRSQLQDAEGHIHATVETTVTVAAFAKQTAVQTISMTSPRLWDTEDPYQYTIHTTLLREAVPVDEVTTRFGFRTIRFDADEGFFLNGRRVQIKGVCCHQDYGLTGKAVPDRVQRYRLRLMKEMGANGFRTVHYPHSETTMDALDELGFLVMDETRWFSTDADSCAALDMLVKRDRNRPGVILWSIANEESITVTENGRAIAVKLKHRIKSLDDTRPVTAALDKDPFNNPLSEILDVIGVNYNLGQYDELHAKYPRTPVIASECCASGTTRAWYGADAPIRGYVSAYDHDINHWFLGRENTWKHLAAREWVCGGYQWAGIEHRGEAVWPRLCSQSGAVDLYLQKKDAFYQNRSHWSDAPMIHLLPHWNHAGREGEPLPVWVYTNGDEAELYLNGQSLGRKAIEPYGHGEWLVPYQPGRLRAVSLRHGEAAAEETVETTGSAAALQLRLEDDGVTTRDVAILTCYCLDEQGRFVPDAAPFVRFDCNELGTVAATGSDVADHTPPACPDRQMRAGRCSLLVRTKDQKGTLRVYAHAEGLRACRIDIPVT